MNGNSGFFTEEPRRDDESEAAKRWRERKEKLRSIRKKERDALKRKMITRTGLLRSETKSAYEWKKLDRKRYAGIKTEWRPKHPASNHPDLNTEDDMEQSKTQTKKRPKKKDNQ